MVELNSFRAAFLQQGKAGARVSRRKIDGSGLDDDARRDCLMGHV
jgi:hypothetical protein